MNTIIEIAKSILGSLGRFKDEEVLCVPRRLFEKHIGLSDKKMVTPPWNSVSRLVTEEALIWPVLWLKNQTIFFRSSQFVLLGTAISI